MHSLHRVNHYVPDLKNTDCWNCAVRNFVAFSTISRVAPAYVYISFGISSILPHCYSAHPYMVGNSDLKCRIVTQYTTRWQFRTTHASWHRCISEDTKRAGAWLKGYLSCSEMSLSGGEKCHIDCGIFCPCLIAERWPAVSPTSVTCSSDFQYKYSHFQYFAWFFSS